MTELQDPQNEMSFEVSIPSALLLNKNIDGVCVKLFAFIKSLTRAHGYCFASNKYLARLMGVAERTIQRYLHDLASHGYIDLLFEVVGNQSQRRIFIGTKLDKSGGYDKFDVGVRQNCRGGTTNLSCISNRSSISKIVDVERATTKGISFDTTSEKFMGITDKDIKDWKSIFTAINVEKELEEARLWAKTEYRKNYRKSLNTWMGNANRRHTTAYSGNKSGQTEQVITDVDREKNEAIAKKWESLPEAKKNSFYWITAGIDKVIFGLPNDAGYNVSYCLTSEDFLKKCKPALTKMRIETFDDDAIIEVT